MVQSKAQTVAEYLGELPDDRREIIENVRQLVLENLPDGYDETMRWGMITYEVPLDRYPDTYNGKPLQYVGLAAQKHYNALYLNNVAFSPDEEDAFRARWEATGRTLDMGKSCASASRASISSTVRFWRRRSPKPPSTPTSSATRRGATPELASYMANA